jgi:hypothetical protein
MSRPAADIALLRFLRANAGDTTVLNGDGPHATVQTTIAGELMRAARALLARGGAEGTPYAEIARSPEFAAYRSLTRALRDFEPATLEGRRARTAFWINVYNALVIDAVISFGIGDSIREALGFFRRAAYQIGPYRFCLDDIEHGLLRRNRPQFPRLPPPFPEGDPRIALGPEVLDPRVHFALNCGTRSCPPVSFYEPEQIDQQLDAAAFSFINAEGVRIEDETLILSPLFEFYAEDFGGPEGVRQWVLRYLAEPALRARLADGPLQSGTYDWSLNRG